MMLMMRMHAVLEGLDGAGPVRARGQARCAAAPAAAAAEADDEAEKGEGGRRGACGDEDPGAEAEDRGALREPVDSRDADAQHGRRRRGPLLLVLWTEMVARRRRRGGTGVAALESAARHAPRGVLG